MSYLYGTFSTDDTVLTGAAGQDSVACCAIGSRHQRGHISGKGKCRCGPRCPDAGLAPSADIWMPNRFAG